MSDEQAIRDLIARWHQATADGDVDAILDLMSDDVVFLVAGKPPMRGRDAFATGLRGLLQSHTIVSSGEVQEIGVSGDLAYSWTNLEVRVTPKAGGESISRSGGTLSILRKNQDGKWRLVRDANLLPPA